MATVTKAMDADDTIVIETILRLFNNCLEHLVQVIKLIASIGLVYIICVCFQR